MSEQKRMTDERLAGAIKRVSHQCSNPPVPDDYHLIGTVTAGDLRRILDALTAEPSRVEDTEVEKMCLYLSYVDSYGKKLNADGDRAADLIRRLAAAKASAERDLETERVRLACCGVAAMANTPSTIADRIDRANPYWSASYGGVCAAVDREVAHRDRAETAERERDEWKAKYLAETFPSDPPIKAKLETAALEKINDPG